MSNRRLLFLFQRGILVPGLNSTLILALPPQAQGREFRGVRVSNGVSHHPPCALLRRHSLSTMKPRAVTPPPRRDDTEPHRLILCLQRVMVAAITRTGYPLLWANGTCKGNGSSVKRATGYPLPCANDVPSILHVHPSHDVRRSCLSLTALAGNCVGSRTENAS